MGGMGTGLQTNNPTIVSAFHAALVRQGLVVLLIVAVVGVAWRVLRARQLRRSASDATQTMEPSSGFTYPEPAGRRLLRVSFGLIWIFDGILQGQASMPLGMTTGVIQPAAAVSPSWVQHLDNAGATIWSYHPIAAPASAVWIQIGIGVWLLAAPRGDWSRLAGVASVGWGLIVWIFGEAFGGIFAPGLTWLFGAPGAVLFYCLAGVLIALPERYWATPRLGRIILRVIGLFFVGMAVLQAWPGRGFWQGQARHAATPGTLTTMIQQMAQTPEPHLLSSGVTNFAAFDAAHGWAVNLFAVVALAAIGATFLTGRPRLVRAGVAAGVVVCLADWVLIEDFGFLGGVGTDPNSMIPMALLFIAGYLAITRLPAVADDTVQADAAIPAASRPWRQRLGADPTYAFRSVAALGAIGIILVGAAPMAAATTNRHADPILTQALDGSPIPADQATPGFALVDQHGQPVTLASLHGKAIALTFLDPVCTSDCPTIAQEFRMADGVLGGNASRVDLVAINANPRYLNPDFLVAFDQQERLQGVANWRYLTGSLPQLQGVWRSFGVQVNYAPGGAMIDHSEIAYVIDATGRTRAVLNTDPGPASQATRSSFAVTLADALKRTFGSS
jgi:cytochrome oxidase Cu insertion factor (SCO1/SenC/PrrC family)